MKRYEDRDGFIQEIDAAKYAGYRQKHLDGEQTEATRRIRLLINEAEEEILVNDRCDADAWMVKIRTVRMRADSGKRQEAARMEGRPLKGWHGMKMALRGAVYGRRAEPGLCDARYERIPNIEKVYRVGEEICARYLCVPSGELHRWFEKKPGPEGQRRYGDIFDRESARRALSALGMSAEAGPPGPDRPYLAVHVWHRKGRIATFYMTGEAARRLEVRMEKESPTEFRRRKRRTRWGYFVWAESTEGSIYEWIP